MRQEKSFVIFGGNSLGSDGRRLRVSWVIPGVVALTASAAAFARNFLSAQVAGIGVYTSLVLILRGFQRSRSREWDGICPIFPAPRAKSKSGRRPLRLAAAAALLVLGVAALAQAQQTLFNVPSADVLDKGKFYVEADALWRPQDPSFGFFTMRGVYGFGANVEAGANFGGFASTGRSVPFATVNVKWQPWHDEKLALTTGAFGLFYLRGTPDGDPAALWYGEASYRLTPTTRLTGGGYWASSGYAAADPQAGAVAGFEQKINDHLNLLADWFSGENALGYFTPGVSVPLGNWTIYAGYSIKNGDSKGNAALFELGFTF